MLGMRFTFHTERSRPWLTDGTADWLWSAAEQHGIPLMVLVPGSLDVLDRIAERHPGLRLTIDHVGLNRLTAGPNVFEDLPKVCALARRPNVAVKASGMPSLSKAPYPFPDLHDPIKRLVHWIDPPFADPNTPFRGWKVLSKALFELRAGRHAAAIAVLEPPLSDNVLHADVGSTIVRALALHRSGDPATARARPARGVDRLHRGASGVSAHITAAVPFPKRRSSARPLLRGAGASRRRPRRRHCGDDRSPASRR
jgi:hypothetical protein